MPRIQSCSSDRERRAHIVSTTTVHCPPRLEGAVYEGFVFAITCRRAIVLVFLLSLTKKKKKKSTYEMHQMSSIIHPSLQTHLRPGDPLIRRSSRDGEPVNRGNAAVLMHMDFKMKQTKKKKKHISYN